MTKRKYGRAPVTPGIGASPNKPASLPFLLATTSGVLEAVKDDLPPLTVTLESRDTVLPQITITPSGIADDEKIQRHTVEHLARILSTWPKPLSGDSGGWTATGRTKGLKVDVLAAPLLGRGVVRHSKRRPSDGTAAHAQLLRDLIDWAGALPAACKLQVEESADGEGLLARLTTAADDLPAVLDTHALLVTPAAGIWDKTRGEGVTPTGHRLVILTR